MLVLTTKAGDRIVVKTPEGDVVFTYNPAGQRRKVGVEAPAAFPIRRGRGGGKRNTEGTESTERKAEA